MNQLFKGRQTIAVRLGIWFMILVSLPVLVIIIFVRANIEETILSQTADDHYIMASMLADWTAKTQSMEEIQDYFSHLDDSHGRFIFLLDSDGRFLVRSTHVKTNQQSLEVFPPTITKYILTERDGVYSTGVSTTDIYAFKQVPGQETIVVVKVPPSIVSDQLSSIVKTNLPSIYVSMLIIIVIAWVAVWLVVGLPLRKLINAAEEVSAGNLEVSVDQSDMVDELEILAATFNKMVSQLRELVGNLEQRVRERTYQLELTNKELEAFSYSISHDLRAPLRAITGFTQIIEDDYSDQLDTEGHQYLNRVLESSYKMNRLLDGLLGLSNLGRRQINLEAIDLSLLAQEVFDTLMENRKERDIEFRNLTTPIINADRDLMEIAFTNLLSNAIKFTAKKESVFIEFGHQLQGEIVQFFVKDNGIGFDMEYSSGLFSPFQRLHSDESIDGTGIGLAIVSRIIQRHNGRIWAEAELGKGAQLFFTIDEQELENSNLPT